VTIASGLRLSLQLCIQRLFSKLLLAVTIFLRQATARLLSLKGCVKLQVGLGKF